MPPLATQYYGRRGKHTSLRESEGLHKEVILAILDDDIRRAISLLNHYEWVQDPGAVARWRPRLEAALQDFNSRHRVYGRNFRARQRQKRIEADKRLCEVCDAPLAGRRKDARFCSTKCRMRSSRKAKVSAIAVLRPPR